jgi:hypothetical protein
MTTEPTFLAVFTGSGTGPRRQAWNTLPAADRQAREQRAMAAWGAWTETHGDSIVHAGGPLGGTKRVSPEGVADVSNALAVFVVVRAASHEAAARMFEGHPHFMIFPGDAIEVMPVLPVPQR